MSQLPSRARQRAGAPSAHTAHARCAVRAALPRIYSFLSSLVRGCRITSQRAAPRARRESFRSTGSDPLVPSSSPILDKLTIGNRHGDIQLPSTTSNTSIVVMYSYRHAAAPRRPALHPVPHAPLTQWGVGSTIFLFIRARSIRRGPNPTPVWELNDARSVARTTMLDRRRLLLLACGVWGASSDHRHRTRARHGPHAHRTDH